MSRNTIQLRARPEDVFGVLEREYADGDVVANEAPRWLVVRGRELAAPTEIEFLLHPNDDGVELVMREEPTGVWGRVWNPVWDRLLWARNVVELERLQTSVEAVSDRTDTATAPSATEGRGLPSILGAATALAFWGASTIRGKRFFHPTGEVHEAELLVEADDSLPRNSFFREEGTYPAIVRLSQGAGLPSVLPDFPGLAIKLPDRWGPGADQDFLLVSSGSGPVGRRLLLPAPGEVAQSYSSVTPYAAGDRRLWFGAEPTAPDRFAFRAAEGTGDWKAVGSLIVGENVIDTDVTFDIWNSAPDLVPTGLVNALRKPAYAGSRDARGAEGT
jgi:hypothetical protein